MGSIDFHTMAVNGAYQLFGCIFFKILSFFVQQNKYIQVWNNLRASK